MQEASGGVDRDNTRDVTCMIVLGCKWAKGMIALRDVSGVAVSSSEMSACHISLAG